MSTIAHSATAKATIRNMINAHGRAKTLALLTDVLAEELSARRGRPTRAQAAIRKAGQSLVIAVAQLANADSFATAAIDDDQT